MLNESKFTGKSKKLKLIGQIRNDSIGLIQLIVFAQNIESSSADSIIIDLKELEFLNANLCSIIGALIDKKIRDGILIQFINFPPTIKKVLTGNNFLAHFYDEYGTDIYGTAVKFRKFEKNQADSFQKHIEDDLVNKKGMPDMTPNAKKILIQTFLEVFANFATHSKSDLLYTCGQFFPKESKLNYTMVDRGVTIPYNVKNHLKYDSNFTDSNAINWAVQESNSTKKGNTPGGLGLDILRGFIFQNEGTLEIVSNFGFWKEEKGKVLESDFTCKFPGTIINVSFNMNDIKKYYVEGLDNIDKEDIFK